MLFRSIASLAFDPERDRQLKCFEADRLFPTNTTRVAIRRGAYLRDFTFAFIESFAADLTRQRVLDALHTRPADDAEPVVAGAGLAGPSGPRAPRGRGIERCTESPR